MGQVGAQQRCCGNGNYKIQTASMKIVVPIDSSLLFTVKVIVIVVMMSMVVSMVMPLCVCVCVPIDLKVNIKDIKRNGKENHRERRNANKKKEKSRESPLIFDEVRALLFGLFIPRRKGGGRERERL